MEVCNLNNKDDKKPDVAKDAASTGLDPALNKLGAGGPPKYTPFNPISGNFPPYPIQPGFSPGYPPGQPAVPAQPDIVAPCPGMELARAYIRIQRWGQVNSPARALETGTLFPELFRPYPH